MIKRPLLIPAISLMLLSTSTYALSGDIERDLTLTGTPSGWGEDYQNKEPYILKALSYENNGGGWLDAAFDRSSSSLWLSDKKNSDQFKNEVIVEFNNTENIGSFFYTRQKNQTGSALHFSLYASQSNQGNNFSLMATGSADIDAPRVVLFEFEPFEAKRIKLVFDEAIGDKAGAQDFEFYSVSPFDVVMSWFTDATMSALKEDTLSLDDILLIEQKIVELPDLESWEQGYDKHEFLLYIEIAKQLVVAPDSLSTDVVELNKGQDRIEFNDRNGMHFSHNYQVTGVAAAAGDEIHVFVENPESKFDTDRDVELVFTQYAPKLTPETEWNQTVRLNHGYNKIEVPFLTGGSMQTQIRRGGPIYYQYANPQQGSGAKIRIAGGQDYPVIRGSDDDADVRNLVDGYYQDYLNDRSTIGVVDIVTDNIIHTETIGLAHKAFNQDGVSSSRTIEKWNDMTRELFTMFDIADSSMMMTHMIKNSDNNGSASASPGFTQYPVVSWSPFLYVHQNPGRETFSIYLHEMAHQLEHSMLRPLYHISTNVPDHVLTYKHSGQDNFARHVNNLNYNRAYDKAFEDISNQVPFDKMPETVKTLMLVQLELFKPGLWQELHRSLRAFDDSSSHDSYREYLVSETSKIIGLDMSEHFKRYGFIADDVIIHDIGHLEPVALPTWYATVRGTFDYQGDGFTDANNAKITSISGNTLTLTVSDEQEEHLLGYEIYRDGQLVGFTDTNTFKDKKVSQSSQYQYSVKAVDRSLQKHNPSNEKPTLNGFASTNVLLSSQFNHADHVTAIDTEDGDITDMIDVEGSIDTNKEGYSSVTYQVTDSDGNYAEMTQAVFVITASDIADAANIDKLAQLTQQAIELAKSGQGQCDAYSWQDLQDMTQMGVEVTTMSLPSRQEAFSTTLMLESALENYRQCH
ncbi:immunoglobulin-like domain-containing protein [Vibrio renipiscarius]|uniref:Peptidase M60 domain-containing protein n=1 Tax=Vibrio renipiscarius TaxID=1461322 RepID=A0A0C2NCX3_9VIBR|nr:immunoglobulin-like domain-containing protein [Vibrio renipiscarius]KII77491.1 hypothetical protein OJ16_11590 [Vibrio renipiscarius]KII81341.1 hypothetical protein PL18_04255 [Vibrio renipiscarius]